MIAPDNIRTPRNTREAILLAQDISAALIAERALDIHTRNQASAARADLLDVARLALEGLNSIAPALGFGPRVIAFPSSHRARAVASGDLP
jgi:hypothetical protein